MNQKSLKCLLIGITLLSLPSIGHAGASANKQISVSDSVRKALLESAQTYSKAFNAGNAQALAKLWTEDGEYVDEAGMKFQGRKELEKLFSEFFEENKGLTISLEMTAAKQLAPGVVMEEGIARVKLPSGERASSSHYSVIHLQKNDQWLMAHVRETIHEPKSNYEYLKALEFLVGTWQAKTKEGELTSRCQWVGNKNFLFRTYSTKDKGGESKTGLQVIGLDPLLGQFRSWTFDSDGGYATGVWVKDGKNWVIESTGLLRDGTETSAVNVLTVTGADSIEWQAIERYVGDVQLPNTEKVQLKKVKGQ